MAERSSTENKNKNSDRSDRNYGFPPVWGEYELEIDDVDLKLLAKWGAEDRAKRDFYLKIRR